MTLELNIENPRIVLLENIRQTCIYKESKELDDYWNYMSTFAEKCADPRKFDFSKSCADKVIKEVGLNKVDIESCMTKEVESNLLL
jgi:hypothetical protein